jgi:hypothetical protein
VKLPSSILPSARGPLGEGLMKFGGEETRIAEDFRAQ